MRSIGKYKANCFVVSQLFSMSRYASSWDRNSADFTSVGHLTPEPSSFPALVKEFFTYIILHWRRLWCNGYRRPGDPSSNQGRVCFRFI